VGSLTYSSTTTAATFAGSSSSFVNLTNPAEANPLGKFGTGPFVAAFWLQKPSTTGLVTVLSNRIDGSHGNFFCFRAGSSGIGFEADQDGGGTNYAAVGTSTSIANAWHHIAARRQITSQGAVYSFWLDGVSVSTVTTTNPANILGGSPLLLGAEPYGLANNVGYLTGSVAGLKIYQRSVADAEIIQLAASVSDVCAVGFVLSSDRTQCVRA